MIFAGLRSFVRETPMTAILFGSNRGVRSMKPPLRIYTKLLKYEPIPDFFIFDHLLSAYTTIGSSSEITGGLSLSPGSQSSVIKIKTQGKGMIPDQSLVRVRVTPVKIPTPTSMTTAIIT